MKIFIAGILAGLLLTITSGVYAQQIDVSIGKVKLIANNKLVNEDTMLYNSTTYIPLRAASEALNVNVEWDESTKIANLTFKAD